MLNFIYNTPTKLIFGENAIDHLTEVLAPYGKKILLTYGGGSIKKIGLYDEVLKRLEGCEVYELSGIEPNPKYNPSVVDGIKICKEHDIDVVLAVGGGSVLDCSKAICAGAKYEGEAWDLITYKVKPEAALPLVDILTLAATGSEYDNGSVISRRETNEKTCFMSDLLYPVASILDPKYTYSVSKKQTAAGSADAISHVFEQYFCGTHSDLTDGMCEGAIRSIIKNAHIALEDPQNYDARGELMVNCSLACNGLYAIGASFSGWVCHGMEHALSGFYDITHGEGLAILTPRWMKHILSDKTMERFVSLGTHVYGINADQAPEAIAEQTIDAVYDMFESFGIPMHLTEVGIDDSRFEEMAHHIVTTEHTDHAWVPLMEEDVLSILKACL